MPDRLSEAVEGVRERVAAAATRAGRDPGEVRVLAVAKGAEATAIRRVAELGLIDIGENRAQELREHQRALAPHGGEPGVRWHFVGSLQTNKVRYLDNVDLIHSLERERQAEALQSRGERIGRSWEVLVQVNVAGEQRKHGVDVGRLGELLGRLGAFPLVNVRGFMIVAPQVETLEDVRWVFARARELREQHGASCDGPAELSMGMTDDYEIAIEEGATIVRIGRAIFRVEG